MGRLLSFLLGGVALALYGPHLFMTHDQIKAYEGWWQSAIGEGWYLKVFSSGPGIFAGLALILFAIRGKETA